MKTLAEIFEDYCATMPPDIPEADKLAVRLIFYSGAMAAVELIAREKSLADALRELTEFAIEIMKLPTINPNIHVFKWRGKNPDKN